LDCRSINLQVWAKLGTGELVEAGYHDAVQDALTCIEAHIQDERVWEESRWVFNKAPNRSVEMFTRNVEHLGVKRVLKFLHSLSGYKVHMYAVKYMESVVSKQQELLRAREDGRSTHLVGSGDVRENGSSHVRGVETATEEEKTDAETVAGLALGERSWNNTQLAIECLDSIHVAG
jgi:hypothetical protein